MKKIFGLEYGLQAYDNIFQKKRDVDTANSEITNEGQVRTHTTPPNTTQHTHSQTSLSIYL